MKTATLLIAALVATDVEAAGCRDFARALLRPEGKAKARPADTLNSFLKRLPRAYKKKGAALATSLDTEGQWQALAEVAHGMKLSQFFLLLDNTRPGVLKTYLDHIASGGITANEFLHFAWSPLVHYRLPACPSSEHCLLLIAAVLDVIRWAQQGQLSKVPIFDAPELAESYGSAPLFDELFEAMHRGGEDGPAFKRRADGSVSLLWYPRYPDGGGRPNATHIKILVDGHVWSTMYQYHPMKTRDVHERLAQASLRNSYFEFRLRASEEQLLRLKSLLFLNRDNTGTCIHGTCRALRDAGILDVPRPIDRAPPVVVATYLTLMRALPEGAVEGVSFRGRSRFVSLASPDISIDGLIIALALAASYGAFHLTAQIVEVAVAVIENPDLIRIVW